MTELETMQRAKMYLDKLAQGIDPISRQEIPKDSVLNNVRLARCFFYVSGILDQVIANGGRRAAGPVCPGDAGKAGPFQAVYYGVNAQRFILDHLMDILWEEQ